MQRTRVSHPSKRATWLGLAFVAVAMAGWPGCNLVPQTLPPDNGLGAATPPTMNVGDDAGAAEGDAAASLSSSGAFGSGSGAMTGGSGSGSGFTMGGNGGGSGDAATGNPVGVEADAAADGEAHAEGDAGAVGDSGFDAADGAESDAADGAVSDSSDDAGEASPADASADVVTE